VTAVGFTVYEALVPKTPFLALALFNNLTIAVTFLGTFIHGYILWSLLLYLPLYYEAVKDLALTQSGLAVFPESLTVAPTSLIVGILVAKTGKFKWSIVGGWILTTLGTGLLLLLDANTRTLEWVGINLVVGLGTGMLFSGMAFSIQSAAMEIKQDPAFAISVFTFFRSLGAVSHETIPRHLLATNGHTTGGRNRDKRRPVSRRDEDKTALNARTSRPSGTVCKRC
jgi:MFS family permease